MNRCGVEEGSDLSINCTTVEHTLGILKMEVKSMADSFYNYTLYMVSLTTPSNLL